MSDNTIKLSLGELAESYVITDINTREKGMKEFLFTLGCYPGERIAIISHLASNLIINVKDARYSIDDDLASAIIVRKETALVPEEPEYCAEPMLLEGLA